MCENSGRVNTLLQHGEELIQRSEASDAQRVECRLLELLRHCSHVYNNIARTHTRLLSMRLVRTHTTTGPFSPDSSNSPLSSSSLLLHPPLPCPLLLSPPRCLKTTGSCPRPQTQVVPQRPLLRRSLCLINLGLTLLLLQPVLEVSCCW